MPIRPRSNRIEWADTMLAPYRSEAFAEDLLPAPRRRLVIRVRRSTLATWATLGVAALALLSSVPMLLA